MDDPLAQFADKPLIELGVEHAHFDLGDGSIGVVIAAEGSFGVGYPSCGELVPREEYMLHQHIDGSIHSDSDLMYVAFNGDMLTIVRDGEEYVMRLTGMYLDSQLLSAPLNIIPTLVGTDEVHYLDVFTGIDLKFRVSPTMLEERFVLRENPLVGVPLDGTHLHFRWEEVNGRVYDLPTEAKSWDSDPGSIDIPTLLNASGSTVDKGIDVTWLFGPHYPITIDPTVHATSDTQFSWGCHCSVAKGNWTHVADYNNSRNYNLSTYSSGGSFSGTSFYWYHNTWGGQGFYGKIIGATGSREFVAYANTVFAAQNPVGWISVTSANIPLWLSAVAGTSAATVSFTATHAGTGAWQSTYVADSYLSFTYTAPISIISPFPTFKMTG